MEPQPLLIVAQKEMKMPRQDPAYTYEMTLERSLQEAAEKIRVAEKLAKALEKAELILVSTNWIDTGGLKSEIHAALAKWNQVAK